LPKKLQNRLLGAYRRALLPATARPNPPRIWEESAPAADLLVLRRSTDEALSPSHLQNAAASGNPTDPPLPPATTAGQDRRGATDASKKGGVQPY
jgi:hypothetical protein